MAEPKRGSTLRKLCINVFLVYLVYCNIGGMLLSWEVGKWGSKRLALPNCQEIQNWFYMYAVFSGTDRTASSYQAVGSREKLEDVPRKPPEEMLDLDMYSYFPQTRGEAHRRMSLFGHPGTRHGKRQALYHRMATNIQNMWNAAHPDDRVEQVILYELKWSTSPDGYRARSNEQQTSLLGHN